MNISYFVTDGLHIFSHCILTFRGGVLVSNWWQVQAVAGVSTVCQVTLHQAAPHNWLLPPSHGTSDGETRLPGPGHSHWHLSLSSSHCAPVPSILSSNLGRWRLGHFTTSVLSSDIVLLDYVKYNSIETYLQLIFLTISMIMYTMQCILYILSTLHRQ